MASGPNASTPVGSFADAQEKVETWRKYYNQERPQGAIEQQTADFAAKPPRRNQAANVFRVVKLLGGPNRGVAASSKVIRRDLPGRMLNSINCTTC